MNTFKNNNFIIDDTGSMSLQSIGRVLRDSNITLLDYVDMINPVSSKFDLSHNIEIFKKMMKRIQRQRKLDEIFGNKKDNNIVIDTIIHNNEKI